MANVTCFMQGFTVDADLGNDMYQMTMGGRITDVAGSSWVLTTTVSKSPTAQFRRRIRDEIVAYILASLGETVVTIIWPDLTAEDI